MAYYDDNPDYTLRWPPKLFAHEADLLVRRGKELGTGSDWQEEVKLLLQEAFVSEVPANDFAKVTKTHAQEWARVENLFAAAKDRTVTEGGRAPRVLAEDDEPF